MDNLLITKKSVSFNVDPSTGYYLANDHYNDWKFWDLVTNDSWEPNTFNVLHRFLSKDFSYLDIGAWIGPTVLFGAQLSKHCYAFEPDPVAFKKLNTNVSLNSNITNLDIYPIAIGPVSGKILMGTNTDIGDSMSSMLFKNNNSWEVDSLTLQDAFSKFNIKDCNFIKMDIEGGEESVIPASKDFIKIIQPTLYLALHTAWIIDQKLFLEKIKDSLSFYKYIYKSDGQRISLKEIDSLPLFTELLFTNLEW